VLDDGDRRDGSSRRLWRAAGLRWEVGAHVEVFLAIAGR
jgi:hypothetical protein